MVECWKLSFWDQEKDKDDYYNYFSSTFLEEQDSAVSQETKQN